MKKIEITEENKILYEKLYAIKKYNSLSFTLCFGIGILALGFGAIPLLLFLESLKITDFNIIINAIFVYATSGILLIVSIPDVNQIIKLRKFKKEHPGFDIKISEGELEKALSEYNKCSNIPKDIETKKEQHLINFNEEFKKMTNQEKLDFLQEQLEFWQQLTNNDEIIGSLEQQEQSGIQKKIGDIK